MRVEGEDEGTRGVKGKDKVNWCGQGKSTVMKPLAHLCLKHYADFNSLLRGVYMYGHT